MKMMGEIVWKTIKTFAAFIGAVWGIIEIVGNFSSTVKDLQSNGYFIVGSSVLITIIIMIKYSFSYFCHKKQIPGTDASICVKVGDITKGTKGSRLIGINNRLETRNDCIGRNSLHARIIQKHGEENVKVEFDKAKTNLKINSETGNYSFGDSFSCKFDGIDYIFLVMSEMLIDAHPSVTKEQLLETIYHFFHNQLNIDVVDGVLYCPIIGTGAGGSGMNQKEVICEIVRQFVLFKKKATEGTPDRIKELIIVVWWRRLHDIDWDSIIAEVDATIEICGNCNQFYI